MHKMNGLITAALSLLVCVAQAQHGSSGDPYTSTNNPSTSGSSSSGSSSSSSSSSSGSSYGSGYGSGSSYGDIDYAKWSTVRLAHGILASLAFVIFFPVGAITIRVIPSRFAIWIHVAFQVLAYALYICAFGLGLWLALQIDFANFKMIDQYHPIIGIVVFAFLFFQPILGLIHHAMFKKHQRRQVWSYAHIWLGRILITLGIINGGLGLKLANNTKSGEIAYGVVAGTIWLVWMAAAIYGEIKRKKNPPSSNPPPYDKQHSSSDESNIGAIDPAPANAAGSNANNSVPAMRTKEFYR